MKIRVRFTKEPCVKYLGHLDIMRAFQKCMNRAQIKMVYSEGFNPHQKMSFALPLGLGLTSSAEYMDAEIADGQKCEDIINALNKVSGPGFEILSVKELEEGAKKAMASVKFASFEYYYDDVSFTAEQLEKFMMHDEIIAMKKTKKKESQTDIKPQIIKLCTKEDCLEMTLTAGSENNLKPETLIRALLAEFSPDVKPEYLKIKRTQLYADGLVPLEDYETK